MSKITLNAITGGLGSKDLLNANFQEIALAFENTVSRDGSIPNTMNASLDMNSRDILNVGNISTDSILVNGQSLDVLATAAQDAEAAVTLAEDAAIAAAASAASIEASEDYVRSVEESLPDWKGIWSNATPEYEIGDLVREDGRAYICLITHTPATLFSTDLGENKWELFADKGAPGDGTGDMLSSQNLLDVASISSAFNNIKQQATTESSGVVEKATEAEATSGTANKFPDAEGVLASIKANTNSGIRGLVVTNNVSDLEHDIDISSGEYNGVVLPSSITKKLDTGFVAGTGNGGMVGLLPASGVLYIFLITNGASVDVYAETTDGTTPPSGWTIVKRIAVRTTDASSNLQRVYVSGRGEQVNVYPYAEVLDWNVSTVPTTRTPYPVGGVLSCPPNVQAKIIQVLASGVTTGILMTSLEGADTVPDSDLTDLFTSSTQTAHAQIQKDVYVNSNRQVGVRRFRNDVNAFYSGRVISWVEDRS